MTAGKTANNEKPEKGRHTMAQPQEAAGDVGNPADPAEPFNDIADEMLGVQEEEEQIEDQAEPEENGETAVEEEVDDLPPIDAPVSWDAEAKEVFKTLPRDAQEIVQKREAERERFVQQKSQEATQAKQLAAQQASAELAQLNAAYAQQFQQFAASLQAEEPDPMLQVQDPIAYAQQMRAFQRSNAQRTLAQQTAQEHAQQAQALAIQAEHAEHAAQHRLIVEQFPEYTDPTTGPEWGRKLTAVAKELGYPDELIGQARAQDIFAMRKVVEYKDGYEKYQALQKSKMAKVRAAKGLPPVATPGVSQGSDQLRASRANAAWDTAKSAKSRNAKDEALATWMENTGWL